MVRWFLTLGLALILAATGAQAGEWKLDPVHSSAGFSVRHLVISNVTGRFDDFSGQLNFDGKDLSSGSVKVAIKTASVNTANEGRDDHLRNDDFFNAEEYPEMTFESTAVKNVNGNKFDLEGNLTIRGTTKPVVFNCEFIGTAKGMRGETRAGFSAETTIKRLDFGVKFSAAMETGGLVVGDEVKIKMDMESNK